MATRTIAHTLSDAEQVKLRHLLSLHPDIDADHPLDTEYPKMLYHANYVELAALVKDHNDPLVKKDAQESLRRTVVVVHDIETEEEYLKDGYFSNPVDIIIQQTGKDPRVPTGREGRRSAALEARSIDQELRALRRRYAQLTGKSLNDEDDDTGASTVTRQIIAGAAGGGAHVGEEADHAPASKEPKKTPAGKTAPRK